MTKKVATGILSCLLLSLGLVLGCVDPEEEEGGGSTSGTAFYVFDANDSASSRVLVYSNVAALFDNTSIQPSRRLSGSMIETVKNLAWGGMCFDANGNKLFLVSETGDVVRIERARSQNGNISNPSEIFTFRIGEGNQLPSGKFGQASIDSGTGNLYVTEANSSDTRIWVVSNARTVLHTALVDSSVLTVSGDKSGTGVAAHGGSVYGYFDNGNIINILTSGRSYSGPRLRKGTSSSFLSDASLIIGDSSDSTNRTQLAKYGCLAADMDNYIYLARHLKDSSSSGNAVLIFRAGDFLTTSVYSETPYRTFGSGINNLRIISHAITKDWLAGALSDDDKGSDTVWLWRSPSTGSPSLREFRLGSNVSIRGLAFDGSN